MDQSYVEQNAAGLNRLREFIAQLSDEDLTKQVRGGWTVSVVLSHLAFWDRYLVVRWTHAANNNAVTPESIPDFVADFINEAATIGWLACPPRLSAQQAVDAAEEIDRIIKTLSQESIAEAVAQGRLYLVDRTRHWYEHIGQIETALNQ